MQPFELQSQEPSPKLLTFVIRDSFLKAEKWSQIYSCPYYTMCKELHSGTLCMVMNSTNIQQRHRKSLDHLALTNFGNNRYRNCRKQEFGLQETKFPAKEHVEKPIRDTKFHYCFRHSTMSYIFLRLCKSPQNKEEEP